MINGKFVSGTPTDFGFNLLQNLSKTVGYLGIDNLQVAPDGTFTVTVSSAPAAPGEVNHIQMPAGVTGLDLAVRNTLGNWTTEGPASLTVTRVEIGRAHV